MTARLTTLTVTALVLAGATACSPASPTPENPTMSTSGSTLPVPRNQSESMAQLRAQLDPIIAELGTVTEVKTDGVVPCGGSDGSDGYAATYAVWMTPSGQAQQTVTQTIVPRLTAQGWRTEQATNTDELDWSFHQGHLEFGVTFHPSLDNLVVDGSGACLNGKE